MLNKCGSRKANQRVGKKILIMKQEKNQKKLESVKSQMFENNNVANQAMVTGGGTGDDYRKTVRPNGLIIIDWITY